MDNKVLSDPELRRFSGQMDFVFIGNTGQQKLKNTRVAVVGAGALGTAILQQLSALGVGHITIIDFGMVDELSLQNQTLYGGNDLGKLKTIISKERLQSIFPFVAYEIINLQLNEANSARILSNFGWVVDASNHEATSKLIFTVCRDQEINLAIAQVYGLQGVVSIVNFRESAEAQFSKLWHEQGGNPPGRWVISYQFAATLLCNEASRYFTGTLPMPHVKQVFFNLSDNTVTVSH